MAKQKSSNARRANFEEWGVLKYAAVMKIFAATQQLAFFLRRHQFIVTQHHPKTTVLYLVREMFSTINPAQHKNTGDGNQCTQQKKQYPTKRFNHKSGWS